MAWVPFAEAKPLERNFGGPLRANLGLILHVQDGNGELFGWFNNPRTQASSHWWISKSGRLVQYVDTTMRSWAQGAGNNDYCSVETEGRPAEPLTDVQVDMLARLYRWGADTHRWPYVNAEHPGDRGFGWHGMGAASGNPKWGHPFCPGDLRKAQRTAVLTRAAHIGTELPEEDDVLTEKQENALFNLDVHSSNMDNKLTDVTVELQHNTAAINRLAAALEARPQ